MNLSEKAMIVTEENAALELHITSKGERGVLNNPKTSRHPTRLSERSKRSDERKKAGKQKRGTGKMGRY